jgi:hypothetical protein
MMGLLHHSFLFSLCLWTVNVHAVFNLYLGRDVTSWADERGVTTACMTALNQTVNCADDFLPNVLQMEDMLWGANNLTSSCTAACESGINDWVSAVTSACGTQSMELDGWKIQPKTIPLQFQNQYRLLCMKGGSSGWCWVDSLRWQGSDAIRYPDDLCATRTYSYHLSTLHLLTFDPEDPEYDAAVCFTQGFNQFVVEPADRALKSLYNKTMVSPCSISANVNAYSYSFRSAVLASSAYCVSGFPIHYCHPANIPTICFRNTRICKAIARHRCRQWLQQVAQSLLGL